MGTRGLRIVRFRGRYFIYYNHYDSYLEHMGAAVVGEIPKDANKYKEWLQARRQEYAQLTNELEQQVFNVSVQRMQDMIRQKDAVDHEYPRRAYTLPLWKQVDESLHELPTAFGDIFPNLMIEYTYLVDLDQELFAVNNWIFFNLWDIPRDRWISAFTNEELGGMSFSFEICPEAFDEPEPPQYLTTVEERADLSAEYKQFEVELVTASSGQELSHQTSPRDIISLVTFAQLVQRYGSHYDNLLPMSSHDSFAVREFIFAITSLAIGRFCFGNLERFVAGQEPDFPHGFLVGKEAGRRPRVMPIFGSGCHAESQKPGSAPAEDIYWLEDVLISLVPDAVFEQGLEPAVAKAVRSGVTQEHRSFQGLLCSTLRVMFLEVHCIDQTTHVRRTDPVSLVNTGESGVNLSAFAELARDYRGFRTLQNFFHNAIMRKLKRFGQGNLPVEVYANIIAFVDGQSRAACERVNQTWLTLCQDRFHFGHNLELLRPQDTQAFACRDEGESQRRHYALKLRDLGSFTFKDTSTGIVQSSSLAGPDWGRASATWCPIIGSSDRPSIITAVPFRLDLN